MLHGKTSLFSDKNIIEHIFLNILYCIDCFFNIFRPVSFTILSLMDHLQWK